MNLKDILQPMSQDVFLTEILGKRPYVSQGDELRFADLLPWPTINRILAEHRFEASRIRLFKDDKPVLPSVYNPEVASYPERPAFSWQRHRRLKVSPLIDSMRNGDTLRVGAVDELYEPVARLAASIEQVVRERVYASAFLCWGTSGAFSQHWDDNDVIVVQVAGRKRWDLYGLTHSSPGHQDRQVVDSKPPEVSPQQFLLTAGDFLYVPQGCWHKVVPDGDMSLHLSFGFTNRNGHDFLGWAIDEFRRDVEICRQRLPRYRGDEELTSQIELLRSRFGDYLEQGDLGKRFLNSYAAEQPTRVGFSLPNAVKGSFSEEEQEKTLVWLAPLAVLKSTDRGVSVLAAGEAWSFAPEFALLLEAFTEKCHLPISEVFRSGEQAGLSEVQIHDFIRQILYSGLAAERDGSESA
ncbi:cupin domain-containing protein [Streptomyces sp. NPDC096153]|uniref:JmjC domain-containing protein n=1 Tax=Streptomyces sp. NPDC096153 TaxID=3155548 RepID=UPI00331F1405